jgi:hypothetical protein
MRVSAVGQVKEPVSQELHFCAVCHKLMDRHHRESWNKYNMRKCCSVKCADTLRGPVMSCCIVCEGRIPTRAEAKGNFSRRKYCSTACESRDREAAKTDLPVKDRVVQVDWGRDRLRPADRHKEALLYGGKVTDAYRVGFIRRVLPLGERHADTSDVHRRVAGGA